MEAKVDEPEWDVFISYARKDSDQVVALVEFLRSHNLRVFLDESDIRAFTSVPKSIRQALAASRLLIAYFSHVYPTRPACMWELDSALRNGYQEGDPHRRVLVINPERDSTHIELPVLHDTRHWAAPASPTDESMLLVEVLEHLDRVAQPMGHAPDYDGPHPPPAGFTGRFPEMWKLHANVGPAVEVLGIEPHPRGAQVIGPPGIGKTALIDSYTAGWGAFFPGGVHWFRGTVPDTWSEGLTIVEDLDSAAEEELPEWLNLRPATAAVIVTSQLPLDVPLAKIRLDTLGNEGTLGLLESYRKPRTPAEKRLAAGLAEQVGGHPQTAHVVGHLLSQADPQHAYAEVSRQWHRLDLDEVGQFAKRLRYLPGGYSADFVATIVAALPPPQSAAFDLLRAWNARPETASQPEIRYRLLTALGHYVDSEEVPSQLHARGLVTNNRVLPVVARIAARYDPDPTRRFEVTQLSVMTYHRHFVQQKATGSGGTMSTAKERKIAFSLQVELSTRITTIQLESDEGVLSEALESLLSVLRQSRTSMSDLGAVGHTGYTYQTVKQLIDILHPVLRKWHPELLDHQSVRPAGVGLVTHERAWERADELRRELEELRQPLMEIQQSLQTVSGTEL